MGHRLLAFFLFVLVITPWGMLRRLKKASARTGWHRHPSTWNQGVRARESQAKRSDGELQYTRN